MGEEGVDHVEAGQWRITGDAGGGRRQEAGLQVRECTQQAQQQFI